MSVAILTSYFPNYQSLADVVIPNLKSYAEQHGYLFSSILCKDGGDAYGFQKMKFLQKILENRSIDLVLCLDLDVAITNKNYKLEDFIKESGDLFITKDVNGINSGSFIIKNSERGRGLIDRILSYNGREDNEQSAIQTHLSKEVTILPHPSINSYLYELYGAPKWGRQNGRSGNEPTHTEGNWKAGDFLLHLPGITLENRIKIINQKLNG